LSWGSPTKSLHKTEKEGGKVKKPQTKLGDLLRDRSRKKTGNGSCTGERLKGEKVEPGFNKEGERGVGEST